jgi:hypothetical protein
MNIKKAYKTEFMIKIGQKSRKSQRVNVLSMYYVKINDNRVFIYFESENGSYQISNKSEIKKLSYLN